MNPIWLWGLAGLLIPFGIHLLSRKDMRVIRIGSLRHLEDATTRQTVRIQPHAYLLLAVRSLIVAAVALLLAGLYFSDRPPSTRWVLVESGLEEHPIWRPVIDSLVAEGYAAKLLQTGFPEFDTGFPEANTSLPEANTDIAELDKDQHLHSLPDYWALAEAINGLQLDRCVVISRARLQGFTGSRPGHHGHVTWLTESGDSARFVLATEHTAGDSIVARVGRTNASSTSFETMKLSAAEAQSFLRSWRDGEDRHPGLSNTRPPGTSTETAVPADESENSSPDATGEFSIDDASGLVLPVKVVLSGTRINDEERHVMRAVLQAVQDYSIVRIRVTEVDPARIQHGDWLIWLSEDAPPATSIRHIIRKGTGTEVANGFGGMVMGDASGGTGMGNDFAPSVQTWFIKQSLTPSLAIQNQLTLQLATLLLGDANEMLGHVVRQHDRRVMPEAAMFSREAVTSTDANAHPVKNKSSAGVLAVGLVALMILERWMANRQQL